MAGQWSTWILFLVLMCLAVKPISCVDYSSVIRNYHRAASGELLSETISLTTLFRDSVTVRKSDRLQDAFTKLHGINLTQPCHESMTVFLNSVQQPSSNNTWAWKMLDATTKIESGIMQGNVLWVGAFDECQAVRATNDTNEYMFSGMPCSVTINITNIHGNKSPAFMGEAYRGNLMLGLCLPDTCTEADIEALVIYVLCSFGTNSQLVSSTCYKDEAYSLDAPSIGVIVMLSIIGAILAIATLYDILYIQSGFFRDAIQSCRVDRNCEDRLIEAQPPLAENDKKTEIAAFRVGERGIFPMLMLHLSVYSNGAQLLSMKRSEDSPAALNGISFLSLSWIILGHTYIFSLMFIQNPIILSDIAKGLPFQAILGASVSVDTFFLLGGTMVAKSLLRAFPLDPPDPSKPSEKKLSWLQLYFHRFWRITPAYMIVLGVYTTFFKYLGTGPFWKSGGIEKDCPSTWWANLLYLNNVLPHKTSCMAWTWYQANDMQFYIVSPLFLFALYKNKAVGMILISLVLASSMVATSVITYINDYPSEVIDISRITSADDWFTQVYITPWCRIGPHMVGLLLGFKLHNTEPKVSMKWYAALLGWVVAFITGMSVVYGLYSVANNHPLSPGVNALYAGVHRVAWAVAVAWVIFACIKGLGGPINTLLSCPLFIPLSRLTYMAYIINPIVIYWFYLSRKTPIYFDNFMMVYFFLGHLSLSFAFAFIASLSFEIPMMGLEQVVISRTTNQKTAVN